MSFQKLISTSGLLFLVLSPLNSAADSGLRSKIEGLLKPYGTKVSLSLRNSQGEELISLRGNEDYAPASVAKAVSTACSLWKLGPQYQFETTWGYRGRIEGTTLHGDLVVRGTGDPSLVSEQIQDILFRIRSFYNIKKIQGKLIFDVSDMGTKGMSISDGFDGDEGRSFATLLTPLPLNQNSFSIWAAPHLSDGNGTRVVVWPSEVLDLKITNKVKQGSRSSLAVSYDPTKKSATVSGTTSRDGDLRGVYRAAPDVYEYYFRLIERFWINAGGEWPKSSFQIETSRVTQKTLLNHLSKPLSQIMMDVNKFSLNLGAELVFLRAGSFDSPTPVSYEKSKALLKSCLEHFRVKNGIQLQNASGLSRESRIQTSSLTQFLSQFYEHPYAPEYLSSLSLLGADGTTKKRLENYQGRGRLKTGTLKDVHTIAGYLFDQEHRPYSFALFFNRVSMGDSSLKKTEDQVIETLLKENFTF